jgi:uncharacterized protein YktA (UPF0223 family)
MATNKIALIRYQTIDKCLQNHFRKWTLEDLIEKVSEALYEYEGITTGISKRTIQGDIQIMRSDKLGYNAPIIVRERKFYEYEEKTYSIHNSPVSSADLDKMKEVISVMKQLNGFNYFDDMNEIITRLENNISKKNSQQPNYIQFEENPLLKGLEHLNRLYQGIVKKQALLISYQSFKNISKSNEPKQAVYYPYLLKEYRNRWFLLAKARKDKTLYTLALDRIVDFYELANEPFIDAPEIDFEHYYDNSLGVTKSIKDREQRVIFRVNKKLAPYVITKPIHATQKIVNENELGVLFSMEVIHNFELERELLGFGEELEVIGPKLLRRNLKRRLEKALEYYQRKH